MPPHVPTAGLISIGDEILRGDTVDTNMTFLIGELSRRGVAVQRGLVIPDVYEAIVDSVRTYAREYDWVFTGGGIGPTPDDLTRAAVAAALGRELVLNADAVAEYSRLRGAELNPGQLEMCRLPAGCELIWCDLPTSPSFRVDNVYVLPGVPLVLKAMWAAIAERFQGTRPFERRFNAYSGESRWYHLMQQVGAKYPDVTIGSYPKSGAQWYAELVVRGHDEERVALAAAELERLIEGLGFQPR